MSDNKWFSLHTHSRYSAQDALSPVKDLVARASALGYPALGLTDHGNPAGLVQLYKECKKAGISPAPGVELYMTADHTQRIQASNHLTVAAYTGVGYRNLVKMTTLAAQNFYYRPRLDFADLADLKDAGLTEGLLCATGCRSGLTIRTLQRQGENAAMRIVAYLATVFDRCYVELMDHGIHIDGWRDDQINASLVAIADALGLPVIITGDAHYCMPEQQQLHDIMKELVTFAQDPADGRFSGTGYHLIDEAHLARYFEPTLLARGLTASAELAEALAVTIPELDTFTVKVPDLTYGGDPDTELAEKVWAAHALTEQADDVDYKQRIVEELDVIKTAGMAGYLLLVNLICVRMREQTIWYWTRGSATGSLVLHRLQITQDDPIAWKIGFERFLSGDRTSTPDIDLDIDDYRRAEVISWVSKRFAVRRVGQYSALRLDDTDDTQQKGSLKVQYKATARRRAKAAGKAYYNDPKARIPDEDWARLRQLADLEIINNTGTSPSAFVVADTEHDLEIIPMTKAGSAGTWVTAYDKDDIEAIGFPKVDLLGSLAARGLRTCCELIAPEDPRTFWATIPLDNKQALARAGSGHTESFFQLEGWSQRTGLEELNPKRTYDIISAQALFRPGISPEFLGLYMRRRRREEPIPKMHADISEQIADTYGVAIFQEQLVAVLRALGMPALELTAMLKAIKSSGRAGLIKAKEAAADALPGIITLAEARGWDSDDVTWLERALTDYAAGYSFGKAHSVRYGLVAYGCAYLAEAYPLEYWCGMLIAYTGAINMKKQDLEIMYRAAARRQGITVLSPDVNHSKAEYSIEPGERMIRQGLVSISGIGAKSATELAANAPYESLADLGRRCNATIVSGAKDLALGNPITSLGEKTVIRMLDGAGALRSLQPQ